ncbi:unnamed protein product, partial [Brenthis ino]
MDGFTQRPLPPNKKIKIDQQLITMIAKEYHPLNIVNDTEFKKFVALLNSSYSLPTRKTLSESLLPQRYLQLKEQVKNEISKAPAVCITTDSWTSYNNESFIAITAHYIDLEAVESNTLYAESTILDPRFKGKGFCDESKYERALASLKLKVGAMRIHAPESTPIRTEPIPIPSSSTNKEPSIWSDFDEEVASLVPENSTAAGIVEVDKYIQEPILHRLEDPLLWWHTRKSVYPLLYQYILKRLNIVATSVPCERIFSKAGLTLTDRRRRLKAAKVSMLLFIGSNLK